MTRNQLTWRGRSVLANVLRAAEGGIRETTEAASEQAAAETWVGSGKAAESVRDHPRPVETRGRRTIGLWGSRLFRYIFIESGTVHMAGGHFLARAADAHYPSLAARIRKRL